jgi:ketosteroid isomerase-like protein
MTLEERIQRLEDIEEIKQLQVHYINSLILADFDACLECFSEDGVIDIHAGLAKGKEAISKLYNDEIQYVHIGKEGLIEIHPIIKVDGDKATGSWIMYVQYALPRKLDPIPSILSSADAPDWLYH